MRCKFLLLASAAALLATPALAADNVKIGFVTTLTTPAAVIGNDMKDAATLALESIGGKMGNLDVDLIFEDDGFKPEIGKQATDKLVQKDDVDFVTGYIWSNVLLASANSVLGANKFLISANAGPHQLAGEMCNKNFFSTSWQNDETPEAMGEVLNQRGVKSLYVIAPNYAAGKDMVAGLESKFKGTIAGKDLTKWPDQLDFSAEFAKAKSSGAEGIFFFYPGKHTSAFVKQYEQAGLKGKMALYSVFSIDALSLPVFQQGKVEGVLGSFTTGFWAPDLDNDANKKFVADFKKKYGHYPSHYAAQSYDAIMLIKSAVEAVNGDLTNMDGMRAAMAKADYPSVRGKYSYGKNHFPIENFYLHEIVADADGVWTKKTVSTVFENYQDRHVGECKM